MRAPSGGRGSWGMSPGGGGISQGFFRVCSISYSPPQAPLLLLPPAPASPPGSPFLPAGPGDFSFLFARRSPLPQSQSHPGSRPGRCPSSACQLQRQACAGSPWPQGPPQSPPFIRGQRGQWALESYPASHQCWCLEPQPRPGPRTGVSTHPPGLSGRATSREDAGVLSPDEMATGSPDSGDPRCLSAAARGPSAEILA